MLSLANRLKQLLNQDQDTENENASVTDSDNGNAPSVNAGSSGALKSEESLKLQCESTNPSATLDLESKLDFKGSEKEENEETFETLKEDKREGHEEMAKSSDGEDLETGDKACRASVPNTVPKLSKAEREEMKTRSVYAEVFPEDIEHDDLVAFFATYGPVEKVVMRNDPLEKIFKGYVFVIFSTREGAEKFMEEDGTKFRDVELSRKEFKEDYYRELRARAKGKKKKKKTGPKAAKSKNLPVDEETLKLYEERARNEMTKNSVVHVSGLEPGTDRKDIQKFFSDYIQVCHVEFDEKSTEGYVRFKEADSAGPAIEKINAANDGKVVISDREVQLRVVQGDEEFVYWTRLFKNVTEKKAIREERRERKLKKKQQHEKNPHPK